MKLVIDIPKGIYETICKNYSADIVRCAIKNGTAFKEYEKWKQLKETITEIRDNNTYDGNGVTEICRFLINYMGVLEDENTD